MQSERVLFVDDDASMLDTYQRVLFEKFDVDVALGAEKGLESLKGSGPYAVVISDLRMPGMDGIAFLGKAHEISPASVRMLHSGYVDLNAAIGAVNSGHIFRLLLKPCPVDVLIQALTDGTEQYRLITAEKELLQNTLRGTIKLLTDMFSIVDPEAFGRNVRLREMVRAIGQELGAPNVWEIELAWMLSQIGSITIPPEMLTKKRTGQRMSTVEREIIELAPISAQRLLSNIPRLEGITKIVGYSSKRYDGAGPPEDDVRGSGIPLGSRILKAVSDFADLQASALPDAEAIGRMKVRAGWYDPAVFKAAAGLVDASGLAGQDQGPGIKVRVQELMAGDTTLGAIRTQTGSLLIARDAVLGPIHIERIRNFHRLSGVVEPIEVLRKE